jgi:hypothetical protein
MPLSGVLLFSLWNLRPAVCLHLLACRFIVCALTCTSLLLVPVLQAFRVSEILGMQGTRAWAQRVLSFDFDTVIPSHTAAPIRDGKAQFAACFPDVAAQQRQTRPAAAESVRT